MATVYTISKITPSLLADGYLTQQAKQSEDQLQLVERKHRDTAILQDLLQAMSQVEDFPQELLGQLQVAIDNKISVSQLTGLYRKINRSLLSIALKRVS